LRFGGVPSLGRTFSLAIILMNVFVIHYASPMTKLQLPPFLSIFSSYHAAQRVEEASEEHAAVGSGHWCSTQHHADRRNRSRARVRLQLVWHQEGNSE
jgi:hypothetical protein